MLHLHVLTEACLPSIHSYTFNRRYLFHDSLIAGWEIGGYVLKSNL